MAGSTGTQASFRSRSWAVAKPTTARVDAALEGTGRPCSGFDGAFHEPGDDLFERPVCNRDDLFVAAVLDRVLDEDGNRVAPPARGPGRGRRR